MSLLLLFHNNHRFIDFDFLDIERYKKLLKKRQKKKIAKIEAEAKTVIIELPEPHRQYELQAYLVQERAKLKAELEALNLKKDFYLAFLWQIDVRMVREMAKRQDEEDLLLLLTLYG